LKKVCTTPIWGRGGHLEKLETTLNEMANLHVTAWHHLQL